MKDNNHILFCFGLGYTARALAGALAGSGWRVAGTCRSENRCRELASEGIEAFVFNNDEAGDGVIEAVQAASHVLVSVPPQNSESAADADPVIARFSDHIAGSRRLRWIGYLSTTGVYGDHGGDWVDENTPLNPSGERGRRRAGTEAAWLRLHTENALPVHIFRMAGIYGPGRNVIERLRGGTARRIVKEGHVLCRAHIDDIVNTLAASMAAPDPGAIYNVADDLPAPQEEVLAWAAARLGLDVPPPIRFEDAELSDAAKSFYMDCRRVSNARIKSELGVRLKYPDYKAGMESNIAHAQKQAVED